MQVCFVTLCLWKRCGTRVMPAKAVVSLITVLYLGSIDPLYSTVVARPT
jgi:hypothetical protein